MIVFLICGDWKTKEKEENVENKCGGGIDLSIAYVCREKKKKKKKKIIIIYGKRKRNWKKNWINVPFLNDLGGCFEVKV
jgi:hypothetical protein